MSEKSERIYEMIEKCAVEDPSLLDILAALNRRMDDIEATALQAANTASCLANGIRPD
jgi:hypothetical protein